ncbi:hypothetical protein EVA_15684 [gut metagenome]|uniref:Uncharacterized protein n=1 Tax=gut metagenome TaxID=749906 RepID=J9FP23_9ZZZZ
MENIGELHTRNKNQNIRQKVVQTVWNSGKGFPFRGEITTLFKNHRHLYVPIYIFRGQKIVSLLLGVLRDP